MTLKRSSVSGPLSGITVLDLTRVLAGPFATMILADLGARVIKVEVPPRGDDAREIGPFMNGRSAYFMSLNRGKESLAIDLKDDGERQLFDELLEHADVLVENFRPGVMAKLGYGWDDLHAGNPGLIYVATSGFGQSGPYSQRPAYDVVVQGMGGIMSLTGPSRRAADAGRHRGRRHRRRALYCPWRVRGAASSRGDRRGNDGRYRHARLSGGDP